MTTTTLDTIRDLWVEDTGADPHDFDDAYVGCWESFREYSDNLVEDCGLLGDNDPQSIAYRYFDWESFARDLAYDYTTYTDPVTYSVHIFHSNY